MQIGSTSTSITTLKRAIRDIVNDPCPSGVIIPGDIEDEDRPSTRIIKKGAFAGRDEVLQRISDDHRRFIDEKVIPLILPLHTKTKFGIMGVLAGHHWMQLNPVQNSVEYICLRLKEITGKPCPYLGQMMAYLDLRFHHVGTKVRLLGHIQHGEGGGQTKASSITKLQRAAQAWDADFFIRAHDTQLVTFKEPRLWPKETRGGQEPDIFSRDIPHLNLGAFTRGYEIGKGQPSYVEQQMMRPTTMGWGTIKFKFRYASPDEDMNKSIKCDMRVEI